MRRYRLLFLLAALFAALTAGISAVRDAAPYSPAATIVLTIATTPTAQPVIVATATPPVVRTVKPAAPVATAVKADPIVKVIVTAEPGLNLRDAPGGHIVGSVKQGTALSVKITGKWAELVNPEGYRGKFVSAAYVRAK